MYCAVPAASAPVRSKGICCPWKNSAVFTPSVLCSVTVTVSSWSTTIVGPPGAVTPLPSKEYPHTGTDTPLGRVVVPETAYRSMFCVAAWAAPMGRLRNAADTTETATVARTGLWSFLRRDMVLPPFTCSRSGRADRSACT